MKFSVDIAHLPHSLIFHQPKSTRGRTYDINTVNKGRGETDPGGHWSPIYLRSLIEGFLLTFKKNETKIIDVHYKGMLKF